MSVNARRVRGVYFKEFREYRRNRSLVLGMAIIPTIFAINPLIAIFALPASSASALRHGDALLYMLGIPAVVPTMVAAYTVAAERQQGTLEPVLTTPIRREELLLGKALAVGVPSVAIAYAVYAFVVVCVTLFADPAVSSALLRPADVFIQVAFTPLVAGWSIWIGIAISTRAADVRVAQQLGALASLPLVFLTTLTAYDVIHPTLGLAIVAAVVLLIGNRLGWRVGSKLFDRERLITGTLS